MSPLATTLATLVIFFVPGLLIVAAAGRSRLELGLLEQLYVVIAGSLLISGIFGLLLAELGSFSAASTAMVVAGLTTIVAAGFRRRLRLRAGAFVFSEWLVPAAMLSFTIAVYYPPFEHVLGGRDPGIYVNTGFHLARDGTLVYTDPLVTSIPPEDRALFYRVDKEIPSWSHSRFQGFALKSPDTGRVVPHGLHLYPVWIGMASSLFQMKSGLYATPFFAMMGALGFYLAFRRLFGDEVAIWAAMFVCAFQIQIWFARFPNSEVVVQFLFALTLLFFYFMEEHRSRLAGLLAGLALGSTLLARVENILFLVPLGLFFGWKRVRRELSIPELFLLLGFGSVTLQAALHDRLISWSYVSSILGRHYWRFLGEHLLLVGIGGVVGFIVLDRLAMKLPTRFTELVLSERIRLGAALSLFALAIYAYFVRPAWHGTRTAPHDAEAFLRMSWYLYPMGVALAVSGAMVLLVRAKKSQAFFLLVGLTFSLFFFYKVRVWHDHYFAMRRFLPVILPSLLACVAVFLVTLRRSAGRLTHWGAPLLGSLLLLIYVNDGRRLWSHEEFRGSLGFVEELSRHIGDEDVVIFPRQEGLHLLELPLAELHGKNVLEFYTLKPPRELIEDLVRQWSDRYGDIYFVTNYKISLSGLFTRQVKDFWLATEKYEYAYAGPPKGPEPFHLRFTLSKAVDLEDLQTRVPPLPFLDVGNSDDLQVAWFHEKELEEDGTSYRWSQQISSIFLPEVAGKTRKVALRLAGPKENGTPLNPVEVAIDDHTIGTIAPSRSFEVFVLTLPERSEKKYSILTLSTKTWRPSNELTDASDVRDLGVRLDWVELR